MTKSRIEWTDEVWNPVTGCTKVSQGCKHCYAERIWPRMTRLVPAYAGRAFNDVRCHPERLDAPLHWIRPRKVFVNSMSDLFHEDVPDAFIDRVFAVMALAGEHSFQVLTKRPERMHKYMASPSRLNNLNGAIWSMLGTRRGSKIEHGGNWQATLPLPNVWLGVSVENQEAANERIPLLLETPAAVRWLSAEPLLGAVDVSTFLRPRQRPNADGYGGDCAPGWTTDFTALDWVVVGGESGPNARPMHQDWVRSLRDQCKAAGVPFLFKQWGEWAPADISAGGDLGGDLRRGVVQHLHAPGNPDGFFRKGDAYVRRVGKKAAGRMLDGVLHDGYPGDRR